MAFGPIFAPFPMVIPEPIVATPCSSPLRHGSNNGIFTDHNIFRDDTVFYNSSGLYDRFAHDNGIFDLRSLFYPDTGEQDRTTALEPIL